MTNEDQFQEIRSYRDFEFAAALNELLQTPQVDKAIQAVYTDVPVEIVKQKIGKLSTISEFQKVFIYDVFMRILKATANNFTFSGIESLQKDGAYLFISNHRDITLDASLISWALVENGLETPEIAIGDNLLKENWIRNLVRINKGFIVKRNLPPRQLIQASRLLSQYIFSTIVERNQSVWIAQREGRAKDGNDITQPGLLGMLAMEGRDNLLSHFHRLNPVPVSISYEKDPCDLEKAVRIYAERYLGGYVKKAGEDENSMRNGILGYKGNIHIHFGLPLVDKIDNISPDMHKADIENRIRQLLDQQIIGSYKLWPNNYIARDLFLQQKPDLSYYSEDERRAFVSEIENKVDGRPEDKEKLMAIFYEIYARPLINKGEYKESGQAVGK